MTGSSTNSWLPVALPTPRLEDWKYTSLASLRERSLAPLLIEPVVEADDRIKVSHLSKLSGERAAQVRGLRSLAVGFTAEVVLGFVKDPIVINIPSGTKAAVTLRWPAGRSDHWAVGRVVVLVGRNASVSLEESYGAGCDVISVASQVVVEAGASVKHLRIQNGDASTTTFALPLATVARDGRYELIQLTVGSKISREDLTVELLESGATTSALGLVMGKAKQHVDHHTNLIHRVGDTTSEQLFKTILTDEARCVFNGRVVIEKGARGANAAQMNRNLLLSRKAEIDAKPQLEIDNDDVKAAHGAAIGRLDPEHIFYLRSRGIAADEAARMLARGFAYEIADRSSLKSAHDAVESGLNGLLWEGGL